jgi:hypothetical protein
MKEIPTDAIELEKEAHATYVRKVYADLGMQGALEEIHRIYLGEDLEEIQKDSYYFKGRAYYWAYQDILCYAANPRNEYDYYDGIFGINIHTIVRQGRSFSTIKTTKDDFLLYLIDCALESMQNRGLGVPIEYAGLTFGFEQSENIKEEDIKGLIYFWGSSAFDLTTDVTLREKDQHFPLFFLMKLSLIDALKIDDFLNYHLEVSFDNDNPKFQRFLTLLIRHQRLWKAPDGNGGFFMEEIVNEGYQKTV